MTKKQQSESKKQTINLFFKTYFNIVDFNFVLTINFYIFNFLTAVSYAMQNNLKIQTIRIFSNRS